MVISNNTGNVPKFCAKCGTKLTEGSKFCGGCGSAVLQAPKSVVQEKMSVADCKSAVLKAEGDAKMVALQKLVEALACNDVTVPCSVVEDSEHSGVILMKPDVMKNADGKLFFPIFTAKKQVPEKYESQYHFVSVPYEKAIRLAACCADISGYVLDPFCEPLTLSFELLSEVKSFSEKIYVIYNKSLGERFPSIDKHCGVWVFTNIAYANAVVEKNSGIDLAVKAFSKDEFQEYAKSWGALGIERVTVNIGTESSEIKRIDDFLGFPVMRDGCNVNALIVRCKQLRAIKNSQGAREASEKARAELCNKLYSSVFLVPVNCDGDAEDAQKNLYISKKAYTLVNEKYSGKLGFCGAEDFCMPSEDEINDDDRQLKIKTATANGMEFISIFTDAESLNAMFAKSCMKVYSYGEIAEIILKDGANYSGVVVNPNFTNFVLLKDDIALIDKSFAQEN